MGKLRPGGVRRLTQGLLASLEPEYGFPNLYWLARLGCVAVTNDPLTKLSQHSKSLFCIQSAMRPGDSPGNCPPWENSGIQTASVLWHLHLWVTETEKSVTSSHNTLASTGHRVSGPEEDWLWVRPGNFYSPSKWGEGQRMAVSRAYTPSEPSRREKALKLELFPLLPNPPALFLGNQSPGLFCGFTAG